MKSPSTSLIQASFSKSKQERLSYTYDNYGHTSYILLNKQVTYVAYKYVFRNKTLQKVKQG